MNSKGLKSVQYHKVKNAASDKNRERLFRYSSAKQIKNSGQKKVIIIKNMNILLPRVSLLLSVEDSGRGYGSDTHSITEEQNSALGGVGV